MPMYVNSIESDQGSSRAMPPAPVQKEAVRPFFEVLERTADIHTVRRGDTLWHICRTHLEASGRDSSHSAIMAGIRTVAQSNGITNPDLIHPDQEIDVSVLNGKGAGRNYALNRIPLLRSMPPPSLAAMQSEREGTAPTIRPQAPELPARAPAGRSESLDRLLESLQEPQTGRVRSTNRAQSPWERLLGEGPRRLTGEFGMRTDPFTGEWQHHDGIDIAAPKGAPIYPYQAGRVTFSGWQGNYGRLVIVEHDDGTETRYAHASKLLVRPGQRVAPWMPIAHVGASGRATGPHLHFEIRENGRPVDPIPYLAGDMPRPLQRSGRGS